MSEEPGVPKITESQLLNLVLDSLHTGNIQESYPTLKASFPDYEPEKLFKIIALQQAWVLVCNSKIDDASRILAELGDNPCDHFYEMWRLTTNNRVRALLFEYLQKRSLFSEKDIEHYAILTTITSKYPNSSFVKATQNNPSPVMKVIIEMSKFPEWQGVIDLTHDFNENQKMIFPELFPIPEERPVDSPKFFLGNIAMIENQPKRVLKLFTKDGSLYQKLWLMHCEHKIMEMAATFKEEIDKSKNVQNPKLKCLKFANDFYKQMNQYEQETLLDTLCASGYFCDAELADFELLLIRICKNKALYDQAWWSHSKVNFEDFFKRFAQYCAERNLYMPFEMFVISHSKCKDIDLSEHEHPLIRFIWNLWIKRDPSSATLSNLQYLSKSNSVDPVELWKPLPPNSLAPLASFIWNKDPNKFQPNSPETEALSERLKSEYPLLATLVRGEIPHPQPIVPNPPETKWRAPIFTSKNDLELHDLISSHFEQFDFTKVFTDYYGKCPGQPSFPHFDHPELVKTPTEPPYIHYVKAMLPVSAFQQAIDDKLPKENFTGLCFNVMKESLKNKNIRLAALTFIELTDLAFQTNFSVDYKLVISIYDYLYSQTSPPIDNNDLSAQGIDPNEQILKDLELIFKEKDTNAAKSIQRQLNPSDIDSFLLSALLGVRCNLPLDYSAIKHFSSTSKPAELLLYIDRAAEIGANYSTDEIVRIIKEEMPEHPLKDHLLFHLTQELPATNSDFSADDESQAPPALVVYRALRKGDRPPQVALLQEALDRKEQLYALLATGVEGSDPMICALVALFTMTSNGPFDVMNPPSKEEMAQLFLQTVQKLLLEKKSAEILKALELFNDESITTYLARLYHSVQHFSFRKAELALEKINEYLSGEGEKLAKEDPLLGQLNREDVMKIIYPLQESLARLCSDKSQVHLFRYLELLQNTKSSDFLEPRVQLSKIISKYENFRRAIVKTDLLGDYEKIVFDLALNHSLSLGQASAKSFGISSAHATQEWLKQQFSGARTINQVLSIQAKIQSVIQDADYLFYISLFASLLPYTQPFIILDLLKFARTKLTETHNDSPILAQLDALILHTEISREHNWEVMTEDSSYPPSLAAILQILFPGGESEKLTKDVQLSINDPIIHSMKSLSTFYEKSIEGAIDHCLDRQQINEAKLLCSWRHENPQNIVLLEAVIHAVTKEELTSEQQSLLSQYGTTSDMKTLLNSIATSNGTRYKLIALHYEAAMVMGYPTTGIITKKTVDFIRSPLSLMKDQWPLVKELIMIGKVSNVDTAQALVDSFVNAVIGKTPISGSNYLQIDDYGPTFIQFAQLCNSTTFVGERLFAAAKVLLEEKGKTSLSSIVTIILHASFCTSDIDECAELLDSLLVQLIAENNLNVITKVVSVFGDPALLPRYFQYLITQNKLDSLPHDQLSNNVGRVIMNCARRLPSFKPESYLQLTMNYKLYREHAELQMECGNRILQKNSDKPQIQEASQHYLLALAYFLHEKCYSLAMECLKKLSLISLQLEVSHPSVMHLTKDQVTEFMSTKEFPFALTVAIAYDCDTEENWSKALFDQSILKNCPDFLTSYQYFRPITATLCDGVVSRFKEEKKKLMEQDVKPAELNKMEERIKQFLLTIPNLVDRYRVAKELQFQDQIDTMKEVSPVVCEWCEKVLLND